MRYYARRRSDSMPSQRSSSNRSGPRRVRNVKPSNLKPFVALASTVQGEVEARLSTILDAELESTARIAPEVTEMVAALSDLCRRGGKRLRPTLLVVGALAASPRAKLEVAFDAGVALELLQAYFLIHDDWMDGDAIRRGGPSVHTLLTQRFADRHKGESAAILAGDYAVALATQRLSALPIPAKIHAQLFAAFARMQLSAVAGQQIDVVARASDVEQAYALKTGSYTVQGPLELGAVLAGGSRATLAALTRFAQPLGIAFQLRDDLIGAFGKPEETGKPFGADVKAGKRTALLVKALARARGADRRLLSRVVGNPRAAEHDVLAVLAVFDRTGARAEVEARVEQLAKEALSALGRSVTPGGRELLRGAVEALTRRRS
jgi:geranylgeranyl diphosphate synthase, type I